MAERELRKLGRGELVEIIYALKQENQALTDRCRELEEKLAAQEMTISEAGSIAEATVGLSQIFQQAQAAADSYLDKIHQMNAGTEEKARAVLSRAEAEAAETRRKAEAECKALREQTDKEVAEKRRDLERKAKAVLDSHAELRALVRDIYAREGSYGR